MSEEEEKSVRATKKVKSHDDEGLEVEVNMQEVAKPENQLSFREVLMNIPDLVGKDDLCEEDWLDKDMPENRWHKEAVEPENLQLVVQGAIPEILISDDELAKCSMNQRRTLVINVLGKKVNYRALENKLNRDWERAGKIKIIDMPRGYYTVQFEKDADYTNVIFQGPWMIADHNILVQRWRKNFLKSARVVQKVAVWVRIPKLPLELYNDIFLKQLVIVWGVCSKLIN